MAKGRNYLGAVPLHDCKRWSREASATVDSALDFFPVTDLHDEHDQFFVSNRLDDSVGTFTDTVKVILSDRVVEL